MGTSVNQGSPKTPGWNAVSRCYKDERIPIDRTAIEIWRAANKQGIALLDQLNSSVVQSCMEIAANHPSREKAAFEVKQISAQKENSIVGEFAKRALLSAAYGGYKESASANFFRQLTDYYVARDIPGYVGKDYRCKTVADIRTFKQQVSGTVANKVASFEKVSPGLKWRDKVQGILGELLR